MKSYITGFILIALSVFVVLVLGSKTVFAAKTVVTPIVTPSPTPPPSEVNSFELFWPLVAGKTEDEPLYFLKQLKEKVRGFLIFGVPQKLDYNVLLTTKRILETEKLLKEGKTDVAKKTLTRAQAQLSKAEKNLDEAKSSNQSLGQVSQVVMSRLSNIGKLTASLANKYPELKNILVGISTKATSLSSKL